MGAGSLTILYSNENTLFCLNPQITYFKSVFRKHTKFVMTDFHHTSAVNNKRNFSDGAGDVTFDFLAAGDLLAKVSLQIDVDEDEDGTEWAKFPNNIGTALLKNIIFKYNSLEIDSISPEYINFTSMLNNPKPLNSTYDTVDIGTDAAPLKELVCNNGNNYQRMALSGGVYATTTPFDKSFGKMKAIVPIPFSFTKNIGTAFPLFLLTKPDLSMLLQANTLTGLFNDNATHNQVKVVLFKFSLIFKYIYLSEDEKYRFISSPQEYLFEKVKYGANIGLKLKGNDRIDFKSVVPNLPIKCIYLVNKSVSSGLELYNNYKYQFRIRGVYLEQKPLPHEYYSKLNIIENFKGCVYDKWYYNEVVGGVQITSVNSNIAYIPLNLKNSEGPSGCINTGTNEFKLNVSGTDPDTYNAEQTDIDIYLVYYSIMRISENQQLVFPYGNI